MNYKLAMIGLAALSTAAVASPAGAAMPNGLPLAAQQQGDVEQVRYVCNAWGRCWWRPGPRFYGSYAWSPRWHRGYGHRHWRHRHWHRW